jgi:hypothetical protein
LKEVQAHNLSTNFDPATFVIAQSEKPDRPFQWLAMYFHIFKLFFTGLALIFLGAASIILKFVLDDEARLPFWPFDGILAILGGIFVCWWSWTVFKEEYGSGPEEEPTVPKSPDRF